MSDVEMYKGYEISVVVDENPESPREWENLGTMVCWHKDYELGDEQPKCDPVDWLSDLLEKLDGSAFVEDPDLEWRSNSILDALSEVLVSLPLFLYEHGELWMSTDNSHWPFNCRWDCGQVGWIYADRPHVKVEFGGWNAEAREKARERMEEEIATYSSYLHGAVFGWMVRLTT